MMLLSQMFQKKIIKKIKGNQIQIKLLKNSDHRLSKPYDLKDNKRVYSVNY